MFHGVGPDAFGCALVNIHHVDWEKQSTVMVKIAFLNAHVQPCHAHPNLTKWVGCNATMFEVEPALDAECIGNSSAQAMLDEAFRSKLY